MLKIFSSDKESITVEKQKDTWLLNGEASDFDITPIGENQYHIITRNQSITAELLEYDEATHSFTIKINGKTATLKAKTEMDLLLEKMGIKQGGAGKIKNIKAPMPGQVLDVYCQEGSDVKKGEKILILEAMKMENLIKSPGDGKIKSIKVKKGENVEKNHIMVVFE